MKNSDFSLKKVNRILLDICDFLCIENYDLFKEENELIHIDNLKEEIENENSNFNYSIDEFNFIYNQLFKN